MELPKNKLDLDTLCDFAKQHIRDTGDHRATFVLEPRDESQAHGLLFADMENKKQSRAALEHAVKERNAKTYYSIFTAWMAEKKDPKKLLDEAIDDPSKENVEEFIDAILAQHTPPSKSKNKQEILLVTKYDKSNGMDSRLFEITRQGNGSEQDIQFSDSRDITNEAELIETKWNVFHEKQVNLNVLNNRGEQ